MINVRWMFTTLIVQVHLEDWTDGKVHTYYYLVLSYYYFHLIVSINKKNESFINYYYDSNFNLSKLLPFYGNLGFWDTPIILFVTKFLWLVVAATKVGPL
jgi:hypothetical protein